MKLAALLFLVISCVVTSETAKILAYYPIPSISHQVVYRAFSEELAKRGHEVTVITPDPSPNPPENLTQIDVHDMSYKLWTEGMTFISIREDSDDTLAVMRPFTNTIISIVNYHFNRPEVQKILTLEEDHFDLIVGEAIGMPIAFALKNKFKAPLIGISSMSALLDVYEAVGAPTHPMLYTDVFSDELKIDTIWKKIARLIQYWRTRTILQECVQEVEEHIVLKYFGANSKSLAQLITNVDFLILNANPLFTGIRPVGPNTLLVNGLHLNQPKKKLSQDLQNFLDSANEGVVYFSLGTNALAKDFSPEIQQLFKDVLKQLPYKVVWKYELDEMEGKPENVKIMKWVPQMELLGHKNIKAFIMQGGMQSIDEAIFNRVPIVGIPVLGDQDMNIQRVIHHGLGVGLNLDTITREQLIAAVHKVIDDKSFKERITKFSEILEDQPETPLERAIWWTEYVIRHKGAPHLRSPAAGISDWEYFMMDVVLLVIGFVVLSTIIMALVIRNILSLLKSNFICKKKIH